MLEKWKLRLYILTKMGNTAVVNHGKAESAAKEAIKKLAKSSFQPYAVKSKASICSFYVKGNCKRGSDCPFTHQMPDVAKKVDTQKGAKSESILLNVRSRSITFAKTSASSKIR